MTEKRDITQIERFKEIARALGCDEDEAVFDEKLKVIARPGPEGKIGTSQPRDGPGRKTKA